MLHDLWIGKTTDKKNLKEALLIYRGYNNKAQKVWAGGDRREIKRSSNNKQSQRRCTGHVNQLDMGKYKCPMRGKKNASKFVKPGCLKRTMGPNRNEARNVKNGRNGRAR